MKRLQRALMGAALLVLSACGASDTSTVTFGLPTYDVLRGEIVGEAEFVNAEDSVVLEDAVLELELTVRYIDGSVIEFGDILEEVRDCESETDCAVSKLVAPGERVSFDAAAYLDDGDSRQLVRRAVTTATLAPQQETDVFLILWPARRINVGEEGLTNVDITYRNESVLMAFDFSDRIGDPGRVDDPDRLSGAIEFYHGEASEAVLEGDPILADTTPSQRLRLNASANCLYMPIYPASAGGQDPQECTVPETVNGLPAQAVAYQIYEDALFVALPFELVGSKSEFLAGSFAARVDAGAKSFTVSNGASAVALAQ